MTTQPKSAPQAKPDATPRKIAAQIVPLRHGICEKKCKCRAVAAQRRSNKPPRSVTVFAKTNAKTVPSLPSGGRTIVPLRHGICEKKCKCRAVATQRRSHKKPAASQKRLGTLWLGSPPPSFLGSLLRRWRRPSKEAAKPHHFIITSQPQGRTQPQRNAQPTAQPEKGGDEQTPSAASFVGC